MLAGVTLWPGTRGPLPAATSIWKSVSNCSQGLASVLAVATHTGHPSPRELVVFSQTAWKGHHTALEGRTW